METPKTMAGKYVERIVFEAFSKYEDDSICHLSTDDYNRVWEHTLKRLEEMEDELWQLHKKVFEAEKD